MSFVAGFFSFSLEIMNSDRDAFHKLRIKTPLHPYEPREHLYARMVAYVHAYESGLEFSQGFFEPEEPTMWRKNELGTIQTWCEVGVPSERKVKQALRLHHPVRSPVEYRVYFYDPRDIINFCHQLRGSKTNWVSQISFFEISPTLLEQLIALEQTSSTWTVTIVDNTLYLVCNGNELETTITPVPIWEHFQRSIANA